jgi:glycosidase
VFLVNPSLYQVNTRALLSELGEKKTLRDIADSYLDGLAEKGFDWVWFLGVWQTGILGPEVSRSKPALLAEYKHALPDLHVDDVTGSPFAVYDYAVNAEFGGNEALSHLRERLHARGMKLLLDFVPNHMAPDHPWISTHPERFIAGDEERLRREPWNWFRSASGVVFAMGRDPYFAGWMDTIQLNYANSELQNAMEHELLRVSELCDGVRCDMAMLLLPSVFRGTWGAALGEFTEDLPCFWSHAIPAVRKEHPEFLFMAEVYWGLESELLNRGFDYTYDKTLYDRLIGRDPAGVRSHLAAPLEYQSHCVRFLENHDEPRVAHVLPTEVQRAAAVITFLSPGLRFFHQGQFEGKQTKISVHLRRGPVEPLNEQVQKIYDELLHIVSSRIGESGAWQLLETTSAWEGNNSHNAFVCFMLSEPGQVLIAAVNYSQDTAQCYVKFPPGFIDSGVTPEGSITLRDLLSSDTYVRDPNKLLTEGLYLNIPPWRAHIFVVEQGA